MAKRRYYVLAAAAVAAGVSLTFTGQSHRATTSVGPTPITATAAPQTQPRPATSSSTTTPIPVPTASLPAPAADDLALRLNQVVTLLANYPNHQDRETNLAAIKPLLDPAAFAKVVSWWQDPHPTFVKSGSVIKGPLADAPQGDISFFTMVTRERLHGTTGPSQDLIQTQAYRFGVTGSTGHWHLVSLDYDPLARS